MCSWFVSTWRASLSFTNRCIGNPSNSERKMLSTAVARRFARVSVPASVSASVSTTGPSAGTTPTGSASEPGRSVSPLITTGRSGNSRRTALAMAGPLPSRT